MTETVIESVLTGKLDIDLLKKWLNDENIEDAPDDCILLCCTRSEFVAYFLSYLRNQTDGTLQTNSIANAVPVLQQQTPDKLLNTRRKHRRSISDPTNESDRTNDSLTIKTDRNRSQESPGREKKRIGRRVKTKLFTEEKSNHSISSDESKINTSLERLTLSSTPLKNGTKEFPSFASSPVTPQSRSFKDIERCDTPRLYRHSKACDKSLILGDFLVSAQTKSSKKKRSSKNTSNESEDVPPLDLSNSEMFPEIGARKASSLKSDRKRIKPTNLDISSRKSFSLTSFTSECFQQPSPLAVEENSAFKLQNVQTKESVNSFEAERNILKQERHKLMEKFNILNTATSPKTTIVPQIKILKKDSLEKQNFIRTDPSKVLYKDKINILVDIYVILLKNNLVFSIVTELYFLITILLSKQLEDDYLNMESKLDDNNYCDYLLKNINNSTYFAVKSLWHQKSVLEIILDKNSLKTLGENKKVRGFYPDLAKFLLNSYGLKCEADSNQEKAKTVLDERTSNGIVCFNFETDNVDNFPSVLSFQNFKKQRDMFYEIVRWYQETHTTTTSLTSLRARTKTLLCSAAHSANVQRLSGLFVTHMLAECCVTAQESKLSKLQRRLTCPSAPESHRLPHFTPREIFYKEFILITDNESFRLHLKDALASEIIALDATHIANEERGNSNSPETSKDFLNLSKKLALLSKFLGYVTSLPYCQVSAELTAKTQANINQDFSTNVKEKVLANSVGLRDYSQPIIDLKSLLENAIQNGRLIITIPWIIQYLSMLDYISLRIKYYQRIIKTLIQIYTQLLKDNVIELKKNSVLYLKIKLGWLYDLPHFPHEPSFDNKLSLSSVNVNSDVNVDSMDLIDEFILIELCPHLKDLNVLLSTCRVVGDQKEMGSFRHITPVSLSLNAEDRIKNKEKELQARLEEEFLKSQPSSTRRAVELVVERVTSGAVREAGTEILSKVREQARARVVAAVRTGQPTLQAAQEIYNDHLNQLIQEATVIGETNIKSRAWKAVQALLPSAPRPLRSVVVKACRVRLKAWIKEHWNSTAILCKDIEAELKTLQSLGDLGSLPTNYTNTNAMVQELMLPSEQFDAKHVSVATLIINLKEQLYLLSNRKPFSFAPILSAAPVAVSTNNLFCKPNARAAVFQLTIDLCLVFVSRKPNELTKEFLNQLHAIWNTCCPNRKKNTPQEIELPERRYDISPDLRNFEENDRAPTPISDEGSDVNINKVIIVNQPIKETISSPNQLVNNTSTSANQSAISANQSLNSLNQSVQENSDENELSQFFNRVLCPRNIVLLSDTKCKANDVWSAMGEVLVFLLKNDYLSEDSLTEQCLAVYRQDWPQPILENLSTCMKLVSSKWSHSSTGKFTLFLDFLAEFCGDMDYDSFVN